MTNEEYDLLPGYGAASLLNGIGEDGQPILKFAKCNLSEGRRGIVKYWVDENCKAWRRTDVFIADESTNKK